MYRHLLLAEGASAGLTAAAVFRLLHSLDWPSLATCAANLALMLYIRRSNAKAAADRARREQKAELEFLALRQQRFAEHDGRPM